MNFDLNLGLDPNFIEVHEEVENFGPSSSIDEEHNNTHVSVQKEIENRLEVGSKVDDLDHAFLLYCEYARCTGFSVRKAEQRYFARTSEVRWKDFKCSCEGQSNCKSTQGQIGIFKKQVTRTDCKARLRVGRETQTGDCWRVLKFVKIHNHELVASDQSYLLRSARHMTHAKKSVLEALNSAGIGVSRACKFMENESGGLQNLGFTRKDAYTHLNNLKKQTKVENGDPNALVQFFSCKANKEPFFFWSVQMDDDGRLMNFFFRDSRCSVDYELFGDVLSIDTTYRTNKYNLICAPFVGINHHTNNVMFGMGFLSDETTSSFEWLFKTFLESMHGKEPQVIFSDQCQAMMNAIDSTFPNACHRLCQWHINQNAPSHFGKLNGNSTFKKLWHECMSRCESEGEFEEKWHYMVELFQLTDHKWLSGMYKLRRRWATAFSNTRFTAGLLATSRSEVTNKVLKDMCRSSSSLYEFVLYYEQIQENWRVKEKAEDTHCIWMPGQFVNDNMLLNHAAKVYTHNVYKSIEFEVFHSVNIAICEHPSDYKHENLIFGVQSCVSGSRKRHVHFNNLSHHATCTCRKWESEGIFCSHIFAVYSIMNVKALPESYILKRWTKNAKLRSLISNGQWDERMHPDTLSSMTFVNQIMRNVYDITQSAKESKDAREVMLRTLTALQCEVSTIVGKYPTVSHNLGHATVNGPHFRDPAKIVRHWDKPKQKSKKKARLGKACKLGKGSGTKTILTDVQVTQSPLQDTIIDPTQFGNASNEAGGSQMYDPLLSLSQIDDQTSIERYLNPFEPLPDVTIDTCYFARQHVTF